MDDFGVLTERFGLKPQGKSAPMAASKASSSSNTFQSPKSGYNSGLNGNSSFDSGFGDVSFQKNTKPGGLDDYGDFLGSLNQPTKHSGHSGSSPSSFDYDSIFFGSKSSDPTYDDVFGGIPGFKSSVTTKTEDPVRSLSSSTNQNSQIDDLFGNFGSNVAKTTIPKPLKKAANNNAATFDELISGFGNGNSRTNRASVLDNLTQQSTSHPTKSTFGSAKDPFIELESTSIPTFSSSKAFLNPLEEISKFNSSGGTKFDSPSNSSSPFRVPPIPKPGHKADKVKSSSSSPIDELENFAMGKVNASTYTVNRNGKDAHAAGVNHQNTVDDLDSFFNAGPRSKSVPRSRTTTPDPLFDVPKYNKPPEIPKGTSFAASSNIKKSSSALNLVDDLTSMLLYLDILMKLRERVKKEEEPDWVVYKGPKSVQLVFLFSSSSFFVTFGVPYKKLDFSSLLDVFVIELKVVQIDSQARAVADLNQRDFQTLHEQEEKRRIAESLDISIKRWAAGKEGNMRALLSSLQYLKIPSIIGKIPAVYSGKLGIRDYIWRERSCAEEEERSKRVLWSGCGWEPVSLTDMITSSSVKKVYRKAVLCIHPDKVQQKGASIEQKYTAEKVFDILKVSLEAMAAKIVFSILSEKELNGRHYLTLGSILELCNMWKLFSLTFSFFFQNVSFLERNVGKSGGDA
ncbi:Auxilin-related protein 1 [Cucurbita argyrosperma subsp. argyrosperma]|nr:Auxilin-related protein 1 [Cucurbita argyrosperma subsp. argyrosperma]